MLSGDARRRIEEAEVLVAKSVGQDISDAIEAVRRASDALHGTPSELIDGCLHFAVETDENALAAWTGREENGKPWSEILRQIAAYLEHVRSEFMEGAEDDTSELPPNVLQAVDAVKRAAGHSEAPSKIVIPLVIRALSKDDDAAAAWKAEKFTSPAWQRLVAVAAHDLRNVMRTLGKFWRKGGKELPAPFDMTDLFNASEKDWAAFKRKREAGLI